MPTRAVLFLESGIVTWLRIEVPIYCLEISFRTSISFSGKKLKRHSTEFFKKEIENFSTSDI